MTHTEGVLKKFEVLNHEGEGHTLELVFTGYDGHTYDVGIDLEDFLKRVLISEKIGVVTYDTEECEDSVSIRGVAKGIPLTVRYSNNF